jgi:hypothetical protein
MSNRVRKGYGAKEGRWGADKMDGGERHLDRVVYGGQSMSQIHRHDVGSISPDHFKSAHLKNSRCEQRNEPIAYEILISLCCRLLISVHFILRPAAVCSDVPLCIFGFFFFLRPYSLRSDPPVGTGLPDPDRQMCRQTSVLTLAHPSAHPC